MAIFATRRERRLWTVLLVLVATIYATLGVAPSVASALRDRGALDGVFIVSFLLIGAGVVVQGLRSGMRGQEVGILVAAAAVYLMVIVRIGLPEERTHLMEYGVVALVALEALRERWGSERLLISAIVAILVGTVAGTIDELIQAVLPNRVFDPEDILVNILASAIAVSTSATLIAVRRRRQKS